MTKIPKFLNEQEEAEFWSMHDATQFLDQSEPVDIQFVDARPPRTRMTLQLDPTTIDDLKTMAQRKGIDYQTMVRAWVVERLQRELSTH